MRVQLLPSSLSSDGSVSQAQRLTCFVVDDSVAFDAGSLAFGCSDLHRNQIRDAVISHTHLDHIAGLPIFLDDLFASLTEPFRLHVTSEMLEVLEKNIFNWDIYPRFSELENKQGRVLEYFLVQTEKEFRVRHLAVTSISVNHNQPSVGFLISDGKTSIGITGDTSETTDIWNVFSDCTSLAAIFVECAFPDEMRSLAADSHHMTPQRLANELLKLKNQNCPVFVCNIKAMYRDKVMEQIAEQRIPNVEIMEIGKIYEF